MRFVYLIFPAFCAFWARFMSTLEYSTEQAKRDALKARLV
jgi:hypothetical protein